MDVIRLCNMVFYAYHGVTTAEKETGRRFEVDCEMQLDLAPSGGSDSLADTIDYSGVFRVVEDIVTGRTVSLVERLAADIADEILERFPVYEVTVRVRKRIPPIAGHIEYIEIEVTRRQPHPDKLLA